MRLFSRFATAAALVLPLGASSCVTPDGYYRDPTPAEAAVAGALVAAVIGVAISNNNNHNHRGEWEYGYPSCNPTYGYCY